MTSDELKSITSARLASAQILIGAGDWYHASYTMAMALECALKAMICKTLKLSIYPQDRNRYKKITDFFWTHEFQQLLILSGLSEIFDLTGSKPELIQNWSEFTQEFTGEWPQLRYNFDRQRQFDENKAKKLHKNLTDSSYGIITKIKEIW